MKKELRLKCRAKVNLTLDVVCRRSDGYHNLEMIMHEAGPFDILSVEIDTDRSGVYVECNRSDIPNGDGNIAAKAARAFLDYVKRDVMVSVSIEKNIPTEAGLGGGSSDAAGVIKALNELIGCGLSDEEMAAIGKSVGADVPFFIYGGCMLAEGIGEVLSPLPMLENAVILIAKPKIGVLTAGVFKRLALDEGLKHPDTAGCIEAVKKGDLRRLGICAGNVLETVTEAEHPEIAEYKRIMTECGAVYSLMSGSGPSVFGVFDSVAFANTARDMLLKLTDEVYM